MAQPTKKSSLDIRITQAIQSLFNQEEQKSKFFFIRRKPAWRLSREWEQPPEAEYKKLLLQEGFITDTLLEKNMSTELSADVRELEQHLLPFFWRMDQQAKFYQNRYYQYQWAFILAAFFTTAFAAVNVFFYTQGWNDEAPLAGIRPTEILGLLTAIISGIAAAVSFLDANQTPQKRWFKARAQAESLRSLYFLFLARARPFDTPASRERVHRMRQKVIDVLRETPPTPAPAAPPPPPPADADALAQPQDRPEEPAP
jgi:hypothetical protein